MVVAYLLDVEKDPLWQDGLVEARYTSDGPVVRSAISPETGDGP